MSHEAAPILRAFAVGNASKTLEKAVKLLKKDKKGRFFIRNVLRRREFGRSG